MIIIKEDIWSKRTASTPICITTNGFVKRNGRCVMGRGIALQARNRFQNLDLALGNVIKSFGNNVHYFNLLHIITFPRYILLSQVVPMVN